MTSYSEQRSDSKKPGDRKHQKAPAFQFYASDFLVGTAIMSAEQVGGYIRLLCYQWTHGSIPNDDEIIQRLTGCGGNAVASIRHKFGMNEAGELINHRLEEVRSERDAFILKQSRNAGIRWENERKKRSGNTSADAVAVPTQCQNNALQSSVFGLQTSNNTSIAQAGLQPSERDTIYLAYPRKVGKGKALKEIGKALDRGHSLELLAQRTKEFAAATAAWPKEERQFIPHPATWFSQDRFLDDPAEWSRKAASKPDVFTGTTYR